MSEPLLQLPDRLAAVVRWEMPAPTKQLSEAQSLALILTDCRNLEELQIIKSHYGEEALKSAWQLLTQQQRAAITTIATGEQQNRSEIVAGDDWQPHPGDRVRCITKALGNRGGQESLEITAVNDDGSLMVRHSGWLPAIGSIAVQKSDLARRA